MADKILVTSGDEPIQTTNHDWTDVLAIPDDTDIDCLILHCEGPNSGFWRLVGPDGDATAPVRLGTNTITSLPLGVNVSGFKLQVKRGLFDGHLTGLYAWGRVAVFEDDEDDEEDYDDDADES